jgi:hypothetical protein
MRIRKKFIYLFAAINIIVNCLFAVPVHASICITPSIISTLVFTDGSGLSFGYLKELEGSAGAGNAAGTGKTPEAVGAAEAEADESIWYSPDIPMKKEHQQLLWDCCKQKGLDYIDMLALISLESNFDEKCSNKKYKGYFQISTVHAANLVEALNTPNNPLDGAVNIKWGTTLFSWILADKRVKDLEGKAKLDAALSIYQRGTGGYDKYGINKEYLKKYYAKRDKIAAYFEK